MTALDPAQLAQGGAAALVTVAATDAWKWVSSRLAQIWGRGNKERERALSAELVLLRDTVAEATARNDRDKLKELELEWRGLLRAALREDSDFAGHFAALLDEFKEHAVKPQAATIWQQAVADRGGRVSQIVKGVNSSGRL